MAKEGPNPYSSQKIYSSQKKSPRCMAYLRSTGRMSLRTIVASRGSLTFNASSVLADICGLLVGISERHIQNNGDLVDKVKNLEVPPGQKLIAYGVSALVTSIPLPDATKPVRIKMDEDPKLQDRTPRSRESILELFRFCLNTAYFTYRGVIYKQKHGAAMGSPVSPIIANIYMEGFEEIALERERNVIIGNSTSWITNIQGAKYKIQYRLIQTGI